MGANIVLRTLRNQSGTCGSRTLGSVLASGTGAGAGSTRRVYGWYMKNHTIDQFYKKVFDINYGQFKENSFKYLRYY